MSTGTVTGQHAIDFFGFLRHSKGEWAGQAFALASWQAFIVGSLFGWRREDGLRRFRTAYAVPRKNGKSTSLGRHRSLLNNLHVASTASRFMPLSSDSSTMDGLNVHDQLCGIVVFHLDSGVPGTALAGVHASCPRVRRPQAPGTQA